MADVLEGRYHDAIRFTLGMNEDELSNAEIDDPYVLPFVELTMVRALPSWELLGDEDLTAFLRATMLKVAATVLPRARLKLNQQESDNKTIAQRWSFMQWDEMEKSIWAQYAEAVNQVAGLAIPTRDLLTSVAPARSEITGE